MVVDFRIIVNIYAHHHLLVLGYEVRVVLLFIGVIDL